MTNSHSSSVSSTSLSVVLVTLLALTFMSGCQNRVDKNDVDREGQAKTRSAQMSVENGQAVLALDSPAQKRLGLEVATLTPAATRRQVTLPAVVVPVQDLATFRNGYVGTLAQLHKTRTEADVARKEYARLKALFEQNQNVSEKALQAAEGALEANNADIRAGQQQLNLEEAVVRQQWGSVVAKWAIAGSPELQRVFDQRDVLVQMTMPTDATLAAPKTISLEVSGATRTEATLVSAFPRIDPRIQGRSFLYVAQVHSGLAPGVNLLAHLSVGGLMKGLIVPTTAVVWSEGKAWVYQQTAADRFARRSVPTDVPLERGFFVAERFSPEDRIVIQGAQALLSEEMLPHRQGGAEPDED